MGIKEYIKYTAYFTNGYFKLYGDKGLKIPLIYHNVVDNYKDIESPYGYAGPYVDGNAGIDINRFKNRMIDENVVCGFLRFDPFNNGIIKFFEINDFQIDKIRDVAIWKGNRFEDFYNNMDRSKKNKWHIAERKGVEFIVNKDYQRFMEYYYKMLDSKSANKFYYFPKIYFEKLLSLNYVDIVWAMYNNEVGASSIFIYDNGRLYYHLSFVTEYGRDKGGSTGVLVYGLQYFMEKYGVDYYILGGGNTSMINDSLFLFKKDFANKILPFYICRCMFMKEVYNKWKEVLPHINKDKFIFYR